MTMKPSLDPSCVLALDFNELSGSTAYDISGNNNHGTIYGAQRTRGYLGRALSFDGVDDYVNIPDSPELNPLDEMTIEIMLNFPGPSSKAGRLVGKTTAYTGYMLQRNSYSPHLVLYLGDGSSWVGQIKTTDDLDIGKWNHVAVTAKKNDKGYIYKNGIQVGENTIGAWAATSNPLRVGETAYYSGYFTMIAAFVRIYNRALSASEIYEHYIYATEQLRRAGRPIFERLKG